MNPGNEFLKNFEPAQKGSIERVSDHSNFEPQQEKTSEELQDAHDADFIEIDGPVLCLSLHIS